MKSQESVRLNEQYQGKVNWHLWGLIFPERQWGTIEKIIQPMGMREYFSHDNARMRTYRWGEDGIAGISDDHQHLCFHYYVEWKRPYIKGKAFGLTGNEVNCGEDVKELYYYLDATPYTFFISNIYINIRSMPIRINGW